MQPSALVIKPPEPLRFDAKLPSVFLAGSIEMGAAENWQEEVERAYADLPIVILNPRRENWDSSWRQSIDNPQFRGQVEWELEGQERSTIILMYFSPETKSPVTLLEFGLFARSGKLIVCCAEGYWRKANVEIACARYGVPTVRSIEELLSAGRARLPS